MRRSFPRILIALVAFSTAGPELIGAQASSSAIASSAVARLLLAPPAKRYCSGIWVSERKRTDALYNSVLLDEELLEDYADGRLSFDIDDERRIVVA